jgi:TPP-dependent pyruvate/acetoin dehydrogenase alpha subunit
MAKKTDHQSLNIPGEEILSNMLIKMYQIRYFEQVAGRLYQKGQVKGGVHPYIGQEAIAVGISAHLRKDDLITSTHRGHGHHIAKGADLNRLLAEVIGKETGYCKGRGGSMHVAAFDAGSLGAFAINASGVPVAVGAALSAVLQEKDIVIVAYFGEGALAQGTLHESLNMASVWKLPVIFVCENNEYAVSTPSEMTISYQDMKALAEVYNMWGEDINGQDIMEVYETAGRVIKRAREGKGPAFFHARTYRFEGHYFGEPQIYRTREEVQEARNTLDPIRIFLDYLFTHNLMSQEDAQKIDQQAQKDIQKALNFAEESPEPKPEEYAKYVYA